MEASVAVHSSAAFAGMTILFAFNTCHAQAATSMFRVYVSSGSRAIASSSQPASSFHTSSINLSQATKRIGARNKKKNLVRTAERLKQAAANRPSVVLGTRPTEEAQKWKNSTLAKILVSEEDLASTTEMQTVKFSVGNVELPKEFGFGVQETEKKMLFEDLPAASRQMTSHLRGQSNPEFDQERYQEEQARELKKANLVAKALDLRNANAAGIAFENRRRIIQAFSTPENPFDTGRTEVQVALLTYKIRNLWTHLMNFKRDVGNRRSLRKLVHQRASLLRYLKGQDRDRYETILDQLALEPEGVEGELVV